MAVMLLALLMALLPMTVAKAAVDESEPNDSFAEADSIPMNRFVYGEGDEDYYDYYKVNLPASGSLTITFVNDKYYDYYYSEYFSIDFYNKYYECITDSTNYSTTTTRPNKKTLSLHKGTNYIRISAVQDHPYHFKLSYNIPRTTSSLKAWKKAFTVKWAKKSGAKKYQIRYSTKKNMSGSKVVSVSNKAKSKTIKKLKAKKRYYVQVRVVKSIGGISYFSAWSPKKSVVTNA
jgi:hypothetical protein